MRDGGNSQSFRSDLFSDDSSVFVFDSGPNVPGSNGVAIAIDYDRVRGLLPEAGKVCVEVMKALDTGLRQSQPQLQLQPQLQPQPLSLAASVPPAALLDLCILYLQMLVDVFHDSANVEYLVRIAVGCSRMWLDVVVRSSRLE